MSDDDFRRTCLESELQRLGQWLDGRDALIRRSFEAGVSKQRIHRLTGIARTTIDRIVGTSPVACPCCGKPRLEHAPPIPSTSS